MQPDVKRALVLGGTGAVGRAVLGELARRGVPAVFGYHRAEDRARELVRDHGHTAFCVDLGDAEATRAALEAQATPSVVIHCAAISGAVTLGELDGRSPESPVGVESDPAGLAGGPGGKAPRGEDVASWQRVMAVNVQSAYQVCRWIAARGRPCDIVLVGGLDRAQSLPLPVHFAASQGALSALVMAAAHELGPRDIRVNLVALGVLNAGLSAGLAAGRRRDYEKFSALRRTGTPDEAAKVIVWLALENSYIQGKVIAANGGI